MSTETYTTSTGETVTVKKAKTTKARQQAEQQQEEIDILLPETEFRSSVGVINLRPIMFGDFKKFSAIVSTYRSVITEQADAGEVDMNAIVMRLLIDDADNTLSTVQSVLELTSDATPEQINLLPFHEVVELTASALGLNLNFFVQALATGAAKMGRVGNPSPLQKPPISLSPVAMNGIPSEG